MRRILLGGFGLAIGLGALAPPVVGQDSRTPQQPQRSARLGRPVAVTDPAPADAVTPAGLLTPRQAPAVPTPMPPPAGAPAGGGIGGTPGGQPRVITGPAPGVIEYRGAPGFPAGAPGVPVTPGGVPMGTVGTPTVLPGGTTFDTGVPFVVPSVVPDGGVVVTPGIDSPPFGDCPVGVQALDRVAGAGRWWTSAEYLMWWTKSADVPALVTTGPLPSNGILGQPGTQVLLGGPYGNTFHSGLRVGFGRWFGEEQKRGMELRMFFLGQASSTFNASTDQYPLLARPFNNVNPNTAVFPNTANFGQTSEIVGDPTRADGNISVQLENSLWGAEANYRRRLLGCTPCARLDAIVGYRYVHMHEKLTITENFASLPGTSGFPTSGTVSDQFRANNDFHGGQIGLVGEIRRGRWSIDGRASVAFGNLSRSMEISGSQQLALANGSQVSANGGLLAVPGANIGKVSDNIFAVVPEVGINFGYQLTSRLRMFVGYNFMYFSNAVRAPDGIDTNVDAARIPNFLTNPVAALPGTPYPQPRIQSTGLFIQGINFGLQFTW